MVGISIHNQMNQNDKPVGISIRREYGAYMHGKFNICIRRSSSPCDECNKYVSNIIKMLSTRETVGHAVF